MQNAEREKQNAKKAVMAEYHNKNMAWVDLVNKYLETYTFPYKSQKWYHPVFHWVRQIALVKATSSTISLSQPEMKMFRVQCTLPSTYIVLMHKQKTMNDNLTKPLIWKKGQFSKNLFPRIWTKSVKKEKFLLKF